MTGSDRFQLFLDRYGREISSAGNVVKARVVLEGKPDKSFFLEKIRHNKALQFLAVTYPEKRWYSPEIVWKQGNSYDIDRLISFHDITSAAEIPGRIMERDCDFSRSAPVHIDIFYENDTHTHFILSVNHSLLDHAGMELLLQHISDESADLILQKKDADRISLLKKFIQSVTVTFFVAGKSGWNIQRLERKKGPALPGCEEIVIRKEEFDRNNNSQTGLPYYLANLVHLITKEKSLFEKVDLPVFIPVPLVRRPSAFKNVLLSNRMSFLFFRAEPSDFKDIKKLQKSFLQQMLTQARKNIPEKFESLMTLFRFLPAFIYKAFLNLPSKGHSSTLAFSSLPASFLESGRFMGHQVSDYTHYPPLLSPPGLNVVYMEYQGGLKIIVTFDRHCIEADRIRKLFSDVKHKLTQIDQD
jgi:hypothetical protein